MKMNLKAIILIAVLVVSGQNVSAQVTIGSSTAPQKGVLLDLKTIDANNPSNVTDLTNQTVDASSGGLGLPRVRLYDRYTLDPFVSSQSAEWSSVNKLTYAGLVVYNINVSDSTEKQANKIFSLGLYVWNGSEWTKIVDGKNEKKFFYMPSFNIELTQTGSDSYNLYNEYVKQFTKDNNDTFVSSNTDVNFVNIPTHESGRLYTYDELDFVVTYYDKSIMIIDSIATNGKMYYTVSNLNLTANSFINVVLVVK
jgi:hypothetical protein